MKKFVYGGKDAEESSENYLESFIATCKNISLFNPELMSATTTQTFRDSTTSLLSVVRIWLQFSVSKGTVVGNVERVC